MRGNWGAPVYIDQLLDVGVRGLSVRRVSHRMSAIMDDDISFLICICSKWNAIQDYRRTVAQRSVRYDDAIVPFWLRYGAESTLWTSQTSTDTALTGDPWGSSWMAYPAGGIMSRQFNLSPSSAEILTLQDSYRPVGLERVVCPVGISQTHPTPNTSGKVTVIATEWERNRSDALTYRFSVSTLCMGHRSIGPHALPLRRNRRRLKRRLSLVPISDYWRMQ